MTTPDAVILAHTAHARAARADGACPLCRQLGPVALSWAEASRILAACTYRPRRG